MNEKAQDFLDEIEEMQSDGNRFAWAVETLNGICETVKRMQHVTDGQRRAVSNIRNSQSGEQVQKRSRRYEGWSR